MRILTLLTVLVVALSAHGHWQDVDLKTSDGITLKASYISPAKPGPAMLLVHQCNMDRSSWQSIGKQLHDAGVHVLTLDLRGFGDSEGEGLRGTGGFGAFLQKSRGDVDLAYDYLAGQALVDKTRIAAGGASCGAMLTADLATRRDVKALMLLSGPPSEDAVAHMAATDDLAVFVAAATSDPITPGVDVKLKGAADASPHPRSTAKIYAGPEHGLPMFAKNPDLEPALVAWLTRELIGD